jgi:tRNA 2-selenouridine synthase
MARIRTHQLKGGYKAYRQMAHESFSKPFKFLIIGGSTGSGKTEVLRALAERGEQILDLEDLASHRGSVFGGLLMPPQPTTEQFQNNLFEAIMKLDTARNIWIEDESIAVGKIFLPDSLWRTMNTGQIMEIDVEKSIRVKRLVETYGAASQADFLACMEKIVKKLGGQHFKAAKEKLLQGAMDATIEILLTYYDKAYASGLDRKKDRIRHRLSWNGQDISALADTLIDMRHESR